MSLINDALKRARESQQKNLPGGARPLMPVEHRESGLNWILPALVILLIVVACFFIGLSVTKHTVAKIVNAPETPAVQPVETNNAESDSVILLKAPTNAAAVISDAVVVPIAVQGIMYDPVRPSAIVDGKTVHVGDRVHDFRVKEISKSTITLTGPGGTNEVLGLGE
jgi:hypothetical protein